MKVVIQCAGKKQNRADLLKSGDGQAIDFVAKPDLYHSVGPRPARPDDPAGEGSFRDVVIRYNERFLRDGVNPDRLFAASDLYFPAIYRLLVDAVGSSDVFILSAGWGLVRAAYLLPHYNVTFSILKKVPKYARREKRDGSWRDFNHLAEASIGSDEPIHFFGGVDYLPLYYRLTRDIQACKIIHHKAKPPVQEGYQYEAYHGDRNQNWHYLAAQALIERLQMEHR